MRQICVAGILCFVLFGCSRPSDTTKASAPFYSSASISTGRIASIYGLHLGPSKPCSSPSAGELCDTEVWVDGARSSLLYVSDLQINFRLPPPAKHSSPSILYVIHRGQSGPSVSIVRQAQLATRSALQIANTIESRFKSIRWKSLYEPNTPGCQFVPASQGLKGLLHSHVYYCAQTTDEVISEFFYYADGLTDPKLRLLRVDFHLAYPDPELGAEVEKLLVTALNKIYDATRTPNFIFELGVSGPNPGECWRARDQTLFLHQNQSYVAPAGARHGLTLIAVENSLLPADMPVLPSVTLVQKSQPELSTVFAALMQLLTRPVGEPEKRAAALVEADQLTRSLARLLVHATVVNGAEVITVDPQTPKIREQLAPHGIRLGEPGHYNTDLHYDYFLLARTAQNYPQTESGQRALLELQLLACVTNRFGCNGPNCYLRVIERGKRLLDEYPETKFRTQQKFHIALAYETWWSLSQAAAGDLSAQGAIVSLKSGEAARLEAIRIYQEILVAAPKSTESEHARLVLPRLKLKFDTAERTFFCFSC